MPPISVSASDAMLPLEGKRIAFLGDSITDGSTLPILFKQCLEAAGFKPPICTNVGVGGNRASDMLARLERDVIPFHPDYVTLSAGVNDANTGVPPEDYARDITAIVDRLGACGSMVIILLPTPIVSPDAAKVKPRWTEYTVFLRKLAAQRKLRLAMFDRRMEEAIAEGQPVMAADGVHIDFQGYRVMARELLDTFGYSNVRVLEKMKLSVMPGVISPWRIGPASSDVPLTEAQAADIEPGSDWKTLSLPQAESVVGPDNWWFDQERQRGFAVELDKIIAGKGNRYQALAELANPKERIAYLNTGAGLETIWFNGKKVFQNPGNSGWHPGKERIKITLKPGNNRFLIETGTSFFLSITDDDKW